MLFGFLAIIIAYLLGSIPSGFLLSKYLGKKEDLRKKGSGNIGATNAFRVGGKLLGILTLLADFTKGYIAVFIAKNITSECFIYLSAFFAVIGHIFPVWLKFKGGKGVATSLGVITAISFGSGLCAVWIWILLLLITHIASIASLVSIFIISLASIFFYNIYIFLLFIILFGLILYTHIPNIKRLLKRTENKIINM